MRKRACVLSSLLICSVSQYVQAASPHHPVTVHRTPAVISNEAESRELALCASLSQLHGRGVIWDGADTAARREVLTMIIALCLTSGANSDNAGMTAIRLRESGQPVMSGSY